MKRAGHGRNASFSYRIGHAGCGAMLGAEGNIIPAIKMLARCQIEGYLKSFICFQVALYYAPTTGASSKTQSEQYLRRLLDSQPAFE